MALALLGSPNEVATNASLALLADGHPTVGTLTCRMQLSANVAERHAGHLATSTRSDGMQFFAIATMAGTLLDVSMEVAANASLDTGPRAYSLGLLADGHLATGTAFDGMQLFADTTMTRALLDSLTEVAANASLTIDSAASSLQLPADGHLAVGMQSCGVQIFPSATLACARPDSWAMAA